MVINFLSAANREKFDYHVLSLLGDGRLTELCRKAGFPAFNLSKSTSALFIPRQFFKVLNYCQRQRIQIIQTFGLRADVIGRIAGRFARVPVLISSIRSPDPWRKPWHSLIDRLTAGNVDLFISNSEAGRLSRIKREKFPPEKIVVIHNGVRIPLMPIAEERKELREKFLPDASNKFIISVISNFRPMKGYAEIISAAKILCQEFSDILFIFAGDGPLKAKILKQVMQDNILRHSIHFCGTIDKPEELLFASDIFLLASYWEGCPASVLEAMAAGVPVIATRVGGIPEIIANEESGLLIQPKDPQAIAAAIYRLYNDPSLRQRLSISARQHAEKNFSLEVMTQKKESIYEKLLSEKLAH